MKLIVGATALKDKYELKVRLSVSVKSTFSKYPIVKRNIALNEVPLIV